MNILISVALCWVGFFAVLKYLEVSYPDRVYALLDRIQVTIDLFYIRWRTTSLNTFFNYSLGARGKRLMRHWFFAGVVFGMIGMVASVALLICNIFFVIFLWKSQAQKVNGVLTPVIPGVNVPTSHLGYYIFALLVAGILHEFGHAFAAVSEKCRINAFGMFLMGVYPGAYVDIGEGLTKLPPLAQLKVFCGGAWHNAVVAAACCLILFGLPQLMSPLYIYGTEGPYVMSVQQESVFRTRVMPGDVITGIGGCATKTVRDFQACIVKSFSLLGNHSLGYCLQDGYLADYGTETFECFDSDYEGQLQGFVSSDELQHYCLVASEVMQYPECRANDENFSSCQCVFPRLAPDVALLQLHVKPKKAIVEGAGGITAKKEKIHITFVGVPQELWYSFTVRDYIFRFESLAFLDIDLPYIIDQSLRYLASISAALAMLNMAPVYYLDGEWCIRPFLLLLESWLGRSLLSHRPLSPSLPFSTSSSSSSNEEERREEDPLIKGILRVVSALFVINIGISFINLMPT